MAVLEKLAALPTICTVRLIVSKLPLPARTSVREQIGAVGLVTISQVQFVALIALATKPGGNASVTVIGVPSVGALELLETVMV